MAVTSNDIINNAQAIADLINAGANKKLIIDLSAASALSPADLIHVSQGGADKKAAISLLPSGGGGGSPVFFQAAAGQGFFFPPSAPAPLITLAGGSVFYAQGHTYDDTNPESIVGDFQLPADISAYTTINFLTIGLSAVAAPGSNLEFYFFHRAINAGEDWTAGGATIVSGTKALQGTANYLDFLSWSTPIATAGWAANDYIPFALLRNTGVSGDLVGDYRLLWMRIWGS